MAGCAYLPRHDDQSDVRGGGLVEGAYVRDVDPAAELPLAHLHQILLLQLEQVELEVRALALVELDVARQTVQTSLRSHAYNIRL